MKITKIEATVKKRKLRVAAYCRVSTGRADQEDSLDIQQTTYERYIRSNPAWEFAGVYGDTRSGLNAEKRPGFLQLMDVCRAGKIDLILCKSISRFSRNIVECQRYVEFLRCRNVTVVFEKEKLRTDEPASQLIFSLMCAIAQDESRSISENMHTANRHRVEAGVYTPRQNFILGYDARDGRLVPNEEAWIIQHIFSRYAQGARKTDILKELEAKGAKRKRKEGPLSFSNLQVILSNETYVGDKLLQKQPPQNFITKRPDRTVEYVSHRLKDDHEPLVSRKVWDQVQQRLAGEQQERGLVNCRGHSAHRLYGRLFCGACGQPYIRRTFTSRTPGARGDRHYKVWCCKGRCTKSGCTNPNLREDELLEKIGTPDDPNIRLLIGPAGEIHCSSPT